MITYNSLNFNKLIKQISKNLEDNNIDTTDSQAIIPNELLEIITSKVQSCILPTDKFLSEKCPKCGQTHLGIFPSSYSRNVIFKVNNILLKVKVVVPRLICNNCNSTHAVLPDFCVPLKQYSKQAILEIASLASKTSSQVAADTLNVEAKQVRRFVNLVKRHKEQLNLIGNILGSKFKDFAKLHTLIKYLPLNITEIYFDNFNTIFLYEASERNLYLQYSKLSI